MIEYIPLVGCGGQSAGGACFVTAYACDGTAFSWICKSGNSNLGRGEANDDGIVQVTQP